MRYDVEISSRFIIIVEQIGVINQVKDIKKTKRAFFKNDLLLHYMHTTVETAYKDDVENVIRLIYESVQSIQNGETFSYFDA